MKKRELKTHDRRLQIWTGVFELAALTYREHAKAVHVADPNAETATKTDVIQAMEPR